jgi:hypothetical protein
MTYNWDSKELKFTKEPRHPLLKRLARRNLIPAKMAFILGLAVLFTWLTHESWGWGFVTTYLVLTGGAFAGSVIQEVYEWSKRD